MTKRATYTGAYESELDAVRAVATEMRELTDQNNREYAVFIKISRGKTRVNGERVPAGKYLTSRLIRGKQNNVVFITILNSFSNFIPRFIVPGPRKILIHTHPDAEGYTGNVFSGDPQKWWVFGDVSVPTLLRYDSIYLIAPNGNLYKYEGKGQGINRANTLEELRNLAPIETGWAKASVRYLKDKDTGKYYAARGR